jgi:hypothetical protein
MPNLASDPDLRPALHAFEAVLAWRPLPEGTLLVPPGDVARLAEFDGPLADAFADGEACECEQALVAVVVEHRAALADRVIRLADGRAELLPEGFRPT